MQLISPELAGFVGVAIAIIQLQMAFSSRKQKEDDRLDRIEKRQVNILTCLTMMIEDKDLLETWKD